MEKEKSSVASGYPVDLDTILTATYEKSGSDLHLTAGSPPASRIHGSLVELDYPALLSDNVEALLRQVLQPFQEKNCKEIGSWTFLILLRALLAFRVMPSVSDRGTLPGDAVASCPPVVTGLIWLD